MMPRRKLFANFRFSLRKIYLFSAGESSLHAEREFRTNTRFSTLVVRGRNFNSTRNIICSLYTTHCLLGNLQLRLLQPRQESVCLSILQSNETSSSHCLRLSLLIFVTTKRNCQRDEKNVTERVVTKWKLGQKKYTQMGHWSLDIELLTSSHRALKCFSHPRLPLHDPCQTWVCEIYDTQKVVSWVEAFYQVFSALFLMC